jgi:putative component of toxin-antitoxin plasmid stabilization module
MNESPKYRTVTFYKSYFEDFFVLQRQKVKDKIIWTLKLIEEIQQVPETYLKRMEGTDGLFEIRIKQGSDIFRIFCIFDEGNLVILFNGFINKNAENSESRNRKSLKDKGRILC